MKLTISHVQTVKFPKSLIEKEHLNFLLKPLTPQPTKKNYFKFIKLRRKILGQQQINAII